MSKMKDSGIEWIGEIPQEWELFRVKNIYRIQGGDGFPEGEQGKLDGEFPFMKNSDINGDEIYASTARNYVSLDDVTRIKLKVVPKGSILMGKIGEALKKNHRKINSCDCIIDNNMQALIPLGKENTKFHYYLMKSIDMTWFDLGCTIPSINNNELKKEWLALPKSAIQTAIANLLDNKCGKIDTLISYEEKAIAELKEYKKSIIQKAVTKGIANAKLKDSGVEYFGEVPQYWDIVRNKNLFAIKKEIVGEKFVDYQLLSLTQQGVVMKDINSMDGNLPESFATYQRVPKDTIVIALFDISTRSTTISGWSKYDGMITSAYRVLIPNNKVNLGYYDYLFTHIGSDRCLTSEGKNIRCSIDEDTFGAINTICPPVDEQKSIAEYLDKKTSAVDNLIAIKQQKITELKEYKKSLIYEYVTGKRSAV